MPAKPQIAIVGAGRLGGALLLALTEAGYRISEVISRDTPSSQKRARDIARKTQSLTTTLKTANLNSDLIWFCVPDREIARAARALIRSEERRVGKECRSRGSPDRQKRREAPAHMLYACC